MIHVNCNLCGQDNFEVRFPATMGQNGHLDVNAFRCTSPGYGRHPQIVQCRQCGYVYANPRWDGDDLLDAYKAVEDETYVTEKLGRELTFRHHLQSMEKRIGAANGRSLLDVGAYIGVFVDLAAQAGWQACGVEPSQWASQEAQEQGINVIHGTQDAPELAGKQFDVITMWDVIEHVDDPSGEMAKAFNLLKPGGWLIVHTMNIDSVTARLMGARWPWFMDMHIHYFGYRTMHQMLEKNDFRVDWSGTQGRYLTADYLATRVTAFNSQVGWLVTKVVNGLRLGKRTVPINFGDLFTVFAQRPFS